ncbi:MAG: PRC-barrel domain-containing protein [Methanomassiliicoccaceae archaeon]|nr:PRC-barrel domain-containing protein [Methanomassiliicoccaceae archaeon]
MIVPLVSLKDVQLISADAFEIGELDDVRYDPFDWNIIGLRVISKRSSKLAGGFGKTAVMILPDKFVMNDVMLMNQTIEKIRESAVPDNKNISLLMSMLSSKVVTNDGASVGTVQDVIIDTAEWKVRSVIVKLERDAMDAMGLKKGLFSKINVEIRTNLIISTSDMVHLNVPMAGVKDNMTVLE